MFSSQKDNHNIYFKISIEILTQDIRRTQLYKRVRSNTLYNHYTIDTCLDAWVWFTLLENIHMFYVCMCVCITIFTNFLHFLITEKTF